MFVRMAGHSEKPQTPNRLRSLAAEWRDIADTLEKAALQMDGLQIPSMPMPRANAEEVGLHNSRLFADAARDVMFDIAHGVAGGLTLEQAIEAALSVYRGEKAKGRKKQGNKAKQKAKPDKAGNGVKP